jgi:putative transposase
MINDRKKRHTQTEISTKLAEADALIANGSRQPEVARAIGVSVMTFHRWRKARAGLRAATSMHAGQASAISKPGQLDRIKELQLENSRLRQLLTDMLLEKVEMKEKLRGGIGSGLNGYAAH